MLTIKAHRRPFFRKRVIILILFLGMVVSGSAMTSSVKLAWDPNTEADLAGYRIYMTTRAPHRTPWLSQDLSPVSVPLYLLEDPDNPVFEIFCLENGAAYFFTVTAVNASGDESSFSNTVANTVQPYMALSTGIFSSREIPLEVGDVLVDHSWRSVKYIGSYSDPIVVAGPPSSNDPAGAVVRIDRVTDTGFEISIQEWDYLDGIHPGEATGYMVMEAGNYRLREGKRVEAGHLDTNETLDLMSVSFTQPFETIPVVVATVTTFNEEDAVSIRLSDITENGFRLQLQEQQANLKAHAIETVSYVAWEPSRGELQGLAYTVNTVHGGMDHEFQTVDFELFSDTAPALIAAVQSLEGSDNVVLRWKEKTGAGVCLRLAEEQSSDMETDHIKESVGYIGIVDIN